MINLIPYTNTFVTADMADSSQKAVVLAASAMTRMESGRTSLFQMTHWRSSPSLHPPPSTRSSKSVQWIYHQLGPKFASVGVYSLYPRHFLAMNAAVLNQRNDFQVLWNGQKRSGSPESAERGK